MHGWCSKHILVLIYEIETLCWPKCVCCVLCTLIEVSHRATEIKWLCTQALWDTLQHGEAVHQRDGPKWRHAAQEGYRLERTTRGGGQCRYFARRIWRQCRPHEQHELFECALEFPPILCWAQKMHKRWSNLVRCLLNIYLGTIHLRRRHIFTIFDPYPLPSAFQKNAYEGDFWSLSTVTFWPLAHGDTPPPPKTCWRLKWMVPYFN